MYDNYEKLLQQCQDITSLVEPFPENFPGNLVNHVHVT